MTIDLIIPTFNRAPLLRRLLESVRHASAPPGLEVRTIVVDNNSTDNTRDVVAGMRSEWHGKLEYRFEPIQSKSAALNHGVALAAASLVGMLDDDEEIHGEWLAVVDRTFRNPMVDFISGPYLPRWGAPAPAWLPRNYPGVIGWLDAGNEVLEYGRNYAGVMMGGNAVVRKAAGDRVNWYNPSLGRTGAQIGSGCEDVDFFERLVAAGAKGYYIPELVIYHYIPPHRLTKRYYRSWCFRRSIAQAKANRLRRQPVRHVLGVPRYMIGSAARSAGFLIKAAGTLRWNASDAFSRELALWELTGFVTGTLASRSGTRLL